MDLTSVVVLEFKSKVHQEPCINKDTPNAILSDNRLVDLKMATGDKHSLAVLVDVGDKVVNQHPTIQLRRYAA